MPQTILVVDDEAGLREMFASALKRSGYETECVDDGVAGWNKLRSANYDLLITDNNMPKMTGVELVRKLRSAQMVLPVILSTSNPPRNTEALRLAAILRKPFTLETLRQTVADALNLEQNSGATPPLKQLARRLLAHETIPGALPGAAVAVAFGVFEKIRGPFGRLTGVGGYHSLLSRAQALAGDEVFWLSSLRIREDGSLEGPNVPDVDRDAQALGEGEVVLLAHLLGLLDALIGPALTLRLLHDIWPSLEELDP